MKNVIMLFRNDLRIQDNLALFEASKAGNVIPVFIFDKNARPLGKASKWWQAQALKDLEKNFSNLGLKIVFRQGNLINELKKLPSNIIYLNQAFDPFSISQESELAQHFEVHLFNSNFIKYENILTKTHTPYKVFGFFASAIKPATTHISTLPAPKFSPFNHNIKSDSILIEPSRLEKHWEPTENKAHTLLDEFIATNLKGYKEYRNYPALDHTSRLSPYIRFGQISVNQIINRLNLVKEIEGASEDLNQFLAEILWREFAYYTLYYFPSMLTHPLLEKFYAFEWKKENKKQLEKWKSGNTGFPLIDAGMRELNETGYMHNRVRMVVASFLTKNMRHHWKLGEEYFWEKLVDADLANNAFNWQWVAGTGNDSAPFFRIFNPLTQEEKFDQTREYVKRWVPEYGSSAYPEPMLSLKYTRYMALKLYRDIR